MQTTKEPDQPTTHSSADRKTSMSGVVSAECAALMLAGEKLIDGLVHTYVFFTDNGTHGL